MFTRTKRDEGVGDIPKITQESFLVAVIGTKPMLVRNFYAKQSTPFWNIFYYMPRVAPLARPELADGEVLRDLPGFGYPVGAFRHALYAIKKHLPKGAGFKAKRGIHFFPPDPGCGCVMAPLKLKTLERVVLAVKSGKRTSEVVYGKVSGWSTGLRVKFFPHVFSKKEVLGILNLMAVHTQLGGLRPPDFGTYRVMEL